MNEVMKWTFEENEVRTVMVEGEPYFVGKDVAQVLGYSNTKDALAKHVDDEDKKIIQRSQFTTFDVPNRGLTVINESGLYSLVLSSELPTAKKFKRWVTSEVLPTIRKTGNYSIKDSYQIDDPIERAKRWIAEQQEKKQLEVKVSSLTVDNQIMKPKADYFDELVDRNLLTNIRDTAKELHVKQKVFVQFLLDKKYMYRDKKGKLMPYANHIENGLFEIKEFTNEKTGFSSTQTLITPKGRETFRLLCI